MVKLEKITRSNRRQAKREETIAAFRRSGLNQSQFCRKMGIPVSTLSKWLQRKSNAATVAAFVPLAVVKDRPEAQPPSGAAAAPLELYFRQEWRVVVPADFDAPSVARLLNLLGALHVCAA